jgi:hypothetical protein
MVRDSAKLRAQGHFIQFLKDMAGRNLLRERILDTREKIALITKRVAERRAIIKGRTVILRDLILEEKRSMVEFLGGSKKKAVKECLKRMHDIDGAGDSLDKAIAVYWARVSADYQERFHLWRDIVAKIIRIREEGGDGSPHNEGYL